MHKKEKWKTHKVPKALLGTEPSFYFYSFVTFTFNKGIVVFVHCYIDFVDFCKFMLTFYSVDKKNNVNI